MSGSSPYLLDHASIFIIANSHVPILLEPGTLVASGVIPGDWENEDSMLSMTESHVNYSNGIRLLMNLESFHIVEPCLNFKDDYSIHNIADAFLRQNPHISYQKIGLNYLGGFLCDDPRQWLLERFEPSYLQSENSNDIFAIMPRILFGMEELRALCRLEIGVGNIKRDGEDKSVVTINANIDHGELSSAAAMQEAISLWREKQGFLISMLDRIFGDIEDEHNT